MRVPLFENIQQADKIYFKTGKLPPEMRVAILKITHGDPYTRLVSDIVYHFGVHNSNFEQCLRMGEIFYHLLINYNNKVLPVEFDLQAYNQTDSDKHVLTLYAMLNNRSQAVDEVKELPSQLVRNLKPTLQRSYNNEYYYKEIGDKLRTLNKFLKKVPKDSAKSKSILNKIYSSKNDLDKMVEIAEHYAYAFTNGDHTSKETLIDALEYVDAELVQDSGSVAVVKVNNGDAMQTIGCTSAWCFSLPHSENYWDDYAPYGYVYVIFDFDQDIYSSTFMMVYLPDTGTVYTSTNVTLEEIGIKNSDKYLRKIGVDTEKFEHEPAYNNREDDEDDYEDEEPQKERPFVDPNQMSLFEGRKFVEKKLKEFFGGCF